MKRIFSMILALVMALGIFAAIPSAAPAATVPQVAVNCVKVDFPDAQPYIDSNGRTLIPVRFVTEKLGATVNWDEVTRTAAISKDGTTVEITIGDANMKVTKGGNTSTVKMDTAAVLKDGRTYVPIRYVAEELGAFVDWASYFQIVDIVLPSAESGLTAADIKRLRSYSMTDTQVQTDAVAEKKANTRGQEYDKKLWEDGYTFANAHFVTLSQGPTKNEVRDWTNQVDETAVPKEYYVALPSGSSAFAFAQFVMDMVKADFENDKAESTVTSAFNSKGNGTCSIVFKTDPSLVYTQKGVDFDLYSVRGIVEASFSSKIDEDYWTNTLHRPLVFDYEGVYGFDKFTSVGKYTSLIGRTDFLFDKNGTITRHIRFIN